MKIEPTAWCLSYNDPRFKSIPSNPSMCKEELETLECVTSGRVSVIDLFTADQLADAVAAERERRNGAIHKDGFKEGYERGYEAGVKAAMELAKQYADNKEPPFKEYENTYLDGWTDALNETQWAILALLEEDK